MSNGLSRVINSLSTQLYKHAFTRRVTVPSAAWVACQFDFDSPSVLKLPLLLHGRSAAKNCSQQMFLDADVVSE
jgi:hypothetical protein